MSKIKIFIILFGVFQVLSYQAQVPCNSSNSPTFQLTTSQTTLAINGVCGLEINTSNANTIPLGGALSFSFFAPGSSTNAIIPIPTILTIAGTWTVQVKDLVNFCTTSQTVLATVLQAPFVSIAASGASVCSGYTSTLTASGANSYTWSISGSTTSISVTPATTSTYSVIATGSNVCANTATFVVYVYPQPSITVTANQDSVCLNESITFTVSGANTYTWSTSQTGANLTVSPTVTTFYTVIGEDGNGCKTNSHILVSVLPCTSIMKLKIKDEEFKIYPVPANDQIEWNIFSNELIKEIHYFSIYDNLGLLIREGEEIKFENGSFKINTIDLPNGVYSLQLKNSSYEIVSKRFVIAR